MTTIPAPNAPGSPEWARAAITNIQRMIQAYLYEEQRNLPAGQRAIRFVVPSLGSQEWGLLHPDFASEKRANDVVLVADGALGDVTSVGLQWYFPKQVLSEQERAAAFGALLDRRVTPGLMNVLASYAQLDPMPADGIEPPWGRVPTRGRAPYATPGTGSSASTATEAPSQRLQQQFVPVDLSPQTLTRIGALPLFIASGGCALVGAVAFTVYHRSKRAS